ncbi:MAG: hypothetical protein U0359_22505 [Byssovorax sp.]
MAPGALPGAALFRIGDTSTTASGHHDDLCLLDGPAMYAAITAFATASSVASPLPPGALDRDSVGP